MKKNLNYQVKSAVAMVVFNRFDTAKKVFEQVRKVKPKKLFIIADGPRKNVKGETEKCDKVRKIFDNIDWECEVYKNFSEENLGCSKRPYTGFTWVFEHVEEAIILEDDCLPNISFFKYCDELLEKYRYDSRIMLISGTNQLGKWQRDDYSYHFSNFGGIWGWASWRRAWNYFDIDIKLWNNKTVKEMLKFKLTKNQYLTRKHVYDFLCNNSENTSAWDFQWGFARIIQSGVAISPSKNLITNIGHGEDATHTTSASSPVAGLEQYELEFPLKHPEFVIIDEEYDKKMYKKLNGGYISFLKTLLKGLLEKLKCKKK